jgi:hypothetical protein
VIVPYLRYNRGEIERVTKDSRAAVADAGEKKTPMKEVKKASATCARVLPPKMVSWYIPRKFSRLINLSERFPFNMK